MSVVSVIQYLTRTLCGIVLVVSVFPLCMMPYRLFRAVRAETRHELERGKNSDNPMFALFYYGLVLGGFLYSLHKVGLLDNDLAVAVAIASECLLCCMYLACCLGAIVYIKVAKWRRRLPVKE